MSPNEEFNRQMAESFADYSRILMNSRASLQYLQLVNDTFRAGVDPHDEYDKRYELNVKLLTSDKQDNSTRFSCEVECINVCSVSVEIEEDKATCTHVVLCWVDFRQATIELKDGEEIEKFWELLVLLALQPLDYGWLYEVPRRLVLDALSTCRTFPVRPMRERVWTHRIDSCG